MLNILRLDLEINGIIGVVLVGGVDQLQTLPLGGNLQRYHEGDLLPCCHLLVNQLSAGV